MLKEIYNPPAVLYYKGDLSRINFNKTLAVVGSRKSSTYAKDALKLILSGLKNTDITIVSGLAAGIDTAAHNLAIEFGLKTVGVIASGFDYTYPASNKKLYEDIESEHGVIFSEYYPTFEPLKYRFPQRNRIVSGLSSGTLVAEASLKSGALITANLTLEQGRELMCIPGMITNPNTRGIYKLLKNGATLVTEANDILNTLDWEVQKQQNLDLKSTLELSEDETKVLSHLEVEEKNFDVNYRDSEGRTPLMHLLVHAICWGMSIKCFSYLLEQKADVNCEDQNGISILQYACLCSGNKIEVIKALIRHGAEYQALLDKGNRFIAQALKEIEQEKSASEK